MSNSPPISPVSTVNHAPSRPQSARSISPAPAAPTPRSTTQAPMSLSPSLTATSTQTALHKQQSTPPASSPVHVSTPAGNPNTKHSTVKLAKWGISLVQPTWMALFVIFGILLALGHHLYYASLNGTTAGSASRQQWPIRFGTAFAYLVTSCLNAAVGLAFTQQLWRSVRQKWFSIASLDKMFGITTDPTSFRSWQVLSRAKVVTFLALVAWVLPFAGIIPPATLTVDTVPYPQVKKMAFGIPNWSSRSLITPAIDNTATVPSDVMLRLALQTGLRSQILPIEAPATNSSFGLVFFGPTMRCKAPNDAQKTAFDYYVARIRNESGIFVATDIDDVNAIQQKDPTAPAVSLIYSAFSPRFSEMVNDPSVDATYNGWVPELGSFSPSNPLRPGVLQDALLQELWIQLSDQSIVC